MRFSVIPEVLGGKGFRLLIIILYSVIGLLIYSDVILNGIFLFDDFEYIVGNTIIQDPSYFDLNDTRQIGYMSFALNYAIDGESPFGYHLSNVIIHIINAVLVFFLVEIILGVVSTKEDSSEKMHTVAFFTSLIFLVHPAQTQAVSYITQRFTSLCTLFYLLSVLLYLIARVRFERHPASFRTYIPYILSILSAILAMKTKEIAFTIPFIIAVFEFLLFKDSVDLKRRFAYMIPYIALLVIIPLSLLGPEWGLVGGGRGIAEVVRKDKLYDLYKRSAFEYLFTQFRVIVTYIWILFLPMNLRVVYDFKASHSILELKVMLSLCLLFVIAGYALYLWRRASKADPQDASDYRIVSFGIIWFFITLSIESSAIPIKDIIFEHRIYLPSAGFFLACSMLFTRFMKKIRAGGSDLVPYLSERMKEKTLSFLTGFTLIIAVPLSISTYMRNEVWTDELKFWDDVVQKSPNKAIGYNNRGNAYGKLGMYELALNDLNKTVRYFPKNSDERLKWENADFTPTNMAKTYMNRGQIYYALGDMERSTADFRRARQVMIMPPNVDALIKEGDFYSKHGNNELAIEQYGKVIAWDPENIDALNNQGNAYCRSRRYKEAIANFDKVISLRPDFVLAYYNRGIAYIGMGDKTNAMKDFIGACMMGFRPSCESVDMLRHGDIYK